jgi:hypothetical protein
LLNALPELCPLSATDCAQGHDLIVHARIAVMKALNRNEDRRH